MKLQYKTLFLFAILYLSLCLSVIVTLHWVVLDRFTQIERAAIEVDLKRLANTVDAEGERLAGFATDWATWDDTFQYMLDQNPAYRDANLFAGSFTAINVDGMFMVNVAGDVIWSVLMDPKTRQPIEDPLLMTGSWGPFQPVDSSLVSRKKGLFLAGRGPLIFASNPIRVTDGSGPSRGNLVFVRYFDGRFTKTLQQKMELPVKSEVVAFNSSSNLIEVEFPSNQHATARTDLKLTNTSKQRLRLSMTQPRPVHQEALQTIYLAIYVLLAAGLFLSAIIFYLFQRQVIRPIVFLTRTVSHFSRYEMKLPSVFFDHRNDEVGELAKAFKGMARDIHAQRKGLIEARHQAEVDSWTDPLTGLHNRRYMEQFLSRTELAADEPIWLFLVIDIDHFKQINDCYGHDVGDEVLQQFSDLLCGSARRIDMAVRLGGEEFMLLCRVSELSQGADIAERIRQSVAAKKFNSQDHSIRITCSIGYLSCQFVEIDKLHQNQESILKLADMALFAAKHSGRNAWVGLDFNTGDEQYFPESLARLKQSMREKTILVSSSKEPVTWS